MENNHKRHVLVVDDDEAIREALSQALEDEGYSVSSAANGLKALHFLSEAKSLPSLILLDLMMPEMNGWEFNEEKKLDPRLAPIPVVVITAANRAEEAARPIAPVSVLRKPINLSQLLEVTQKYAG
jgi:CheY-like chemotaxis protein